VVAIPSNPLGEATASQRHLIGKERDVSGCNPKGLGWDKNEDGEEFFHLTPKPHIKNWYTK